MERIPQIGSIAVVGAGTMGTGIALTAALAGHDVVIIDTNALAIDQSHVTAHKYLSGALERGKIDDARFSQSRQRMTWSGTIDSAIGRDLVVEAIVEDLGVKRQLFHALERIVGASAILATNTSSLSVARICEGMALPGRFAGLHFFNPVPAMALVEIIAAPATEVATVDTLRAAMTHWGKIPVVARDTPGFIVNRVARPFYAEGFAALADGIPPADIDNALKGAGGFRMGPLALSDLIGQDINYAAAVQVAEALGPDACFRPQPAQARLVAAKRLGQKSGSGVYDYGRPMPLPRFAEAAARPARIESAGDDALLLGLLRAAGCEAPGALGAPMMRIDGFRLGRSDGRPLAARPDLDILVDEVRDLNLAGTIVLTAGSAAAAAAATGLVQAGGRAALVIEDRPGLLVLRTLAQLANAAADAAEDAVAAPAEIDLAMRTGANHPEGPFSWSERYGRRALGTVLANLAAATGDPIYRPRGCFSF